MFLCLTFPKCDGFLAVSCWFFPLDRYGCLQSCCCSLHLQRSTTVLQPTAWLFSFASAVCFEGIKSLRESCDGLGIVAKVYRVSCSIGMCFSQLDHLLYQETHPDLGFVSQWVIRRCTHTQVHTPAWGESTGVIWNRENHVLPVLLCIFSVAWSH